ncbi:MAG: hypothetical protein L7R66_03610 [Candidatus Thalassarchaeaceae archaeon]|nr:hypothetical protein [Candidatus Thalassarchaeaceae archaeon]
MIIRQIYSLRTMRYTTLYGLFSSATMVSLVLLASFVSTVSVDDWHNESQELPQIEAKMYAVSPGHTVFGEYVGAHWCGP